MLVRPQGWALRNAHPVLSSSYQDVNYVSPPELEDRSLFHLLSISLGVEHRGVAAEILLARAHPQRPAARAEPLPESSPTAERARLHPPTRGPSSTRGQLKSVAKFGGFLQSHDTCRWPAPTGEAAKATCEYARLCPHTCDVPGTQRAAPGLL